MHDALLALPLGLLIGLSLGGLGAGGSILTVPALVLVLGQSPHEAAGTSLIVVGSIAATGAIEHRRRGSMRLRAGLAFAAAGIVGSLIGSILSIQTAPRALALAFSGVMLVAAAMMWRDARAASADDPDDVGGGSRHVTAPTKIARTLVAGSVVGFLTGYFGIGGGFLAVPALTYALGVPITVAIGTSLLVIALNSATALVPRLDDEVIDWTITAAFVAGGVIGALGGARIAHRVPAARLKLWFAVVVACIAVILAATAATGSI